MKYTGPKMKLCRREQNNLFGTSKYNLKKRRSTPGQHGAGMHRHSEYGKLLRNKQLFRRSYLLTEKQFSNIVKHKSLKYSKNSDVSHDVALYHLLETRIDVIVLRAGLASTIMQARQMVNHGHLKLNSIKHNIPSTIVKKGDKIQIKKSLQTSTLYSNAWSGSKIIIPSWLKVDKKNFEIELIDMPNLKEIGIVADLLKVIEYYARA